MSGLPKHFQYHKLMKHREILAWIIVAIQFLIISHYSLLSSQQAAPSSQNKNPTIRPDQRQPNKITTKLVDENGVSYTKIFHTASSEDDPLHGGTCWCTTQYDDFCTCTPSMAIDVILASGDEHIWLVKRKDAGKYANMGGFIEVGEASVNAVTRELGEETGFKIKSRPRLMGVYDDPQRDIGRFRHSVSVVYIVDIPQDQKPHAGDDVKGVVRVHFDEVDKLDFFIDHKNIVMDYIRYKRGQPFQSMVDSNRSVCGDIRHHVGVTGKGKEKGK